MNEEERDRVFVQEFLRNDGKEDAAVIAYRRAGYFEPAFPALVAAERVISRPEIQAAIKASRATYSPNVKGEWSRESVVADFEKVFDGALADRDWAAAGNAKMKQAQLLGLVQESVTVTHKVDVGAMSDEQLLRIINKSPVVVDGQFTDVTPMKGIGHLKPPNDRDKSAASG